eukprot:827689-Heterocapsa_arctica.AAC.1
MPRRLAQVVDLDVPGVAESAHSVRPPRVRQAALCQKATRTIHQQANEALDDAVRLRAVGRRRK